MADVGVEVWRGSVAAWELDNMGHMNVRFYGARMAEALVGLSAALALPLAFTPSADATVRVSEQHIRYLREARSGAPLHIMAAVVDLGECDARLLLQMFHSFTGERACTYLLRVEHVTAREHRLFPWPASTRRAAAALMVPLPKEAGLRSIPGDAVQTGASLAEAERMGLRPISMGAFAAADCDPFGFMRPDQVIARVSDGIPALLGGQRTPPSMDETAARRMGGAVLEYRILHWGWPRVGERFVVRSGVSKVEERAQRLVHWMLDPASGRPWATSEAVSIALDLEARKIVPYTDEHRAYLETRVTPGLAI